MQHTSPHSTALHHHLHYITLHYKYIALPPHRTALHCATTTTTTTTTTATTTTLQLQLQQHQLQLLHTATAATTKYYKYIALHYATLHPAVVVEVTAATTPKTQLQPPVGPSMDLLCHPCITTTRLSCGFLSLKPPPPSFAIPLEIPFFCQ